MAEAGQEVDGTRREVRAAGRTPPGRITSPAYEEALREHLQVRLRTATVVVLAVAAVIFVVDRVAEGARGGLARALVEMDAGAWLLLGGMGGVLALTLFLGRPRRLVVLQATDVVLTLLVVGVSLTIFHTTYEAGNRAEVRFLGLLLVARAVALPGAGRRAFLLSMTAPLGVLAIELAWARDGGVATAGPLEHSDLILWDQAYLWLSVGLAAWASRANALLRRRAFEAGRVDEYVLGERIGGGGMGQVYRATHSLMRRPTALKLLRPEITDERTIGRFEREVRQTARLTHPNTIAIYDYGHTADGAFYYAMELLDGADLDRIVEATGPFPAARAIHCLVQATGSLEEAHAAGLVHRDVKASNLVLTRRGLEWDVLKVTDFGLVKEATSGRASLTRDGEICGSPHTVAPETLRDEPVGAPADIYALGAVGCFLLTGRPIFDARTVAEFVTAHLTSEPLRPSALVPSVPADLEAVLLRCLAKEPAGRFPDVGSLREALLACRDAGAWSSRDAATWWREHGPIVERLQPVDGESARTR